MTSLSILCIKDDRYGPQNLLKNTSKNLLEKFLDNLKTKLLTKIRKRIGNQKP